MHLDFFTLLFYSIVAFGAGCYTKRSDKRSSRKEFIKIPNKNRTILFVVRLTDFSSANNHIPLGGFLTLVEFRTYGRYYYYKKHFILFLRHASAGINVKVFDDSILAQNIEMFSKIGSLPHLSIENDYLPPSLKTFMISRIQIEGNVIYNFAQYQIILRGKIILCKL
jgi:hypothetical protein